jgi:ubiquinone/menaquinone biosynthesis C-methylase UbiE
MNSYYTGKHATNYDRNWKAFSQKTLDRAITAIDVERLRQKAALRQTPLRILDAGCGTGILLKRLASLFPSAHLYGMDASSDMLAQAERLLQHLPNIHLHQGKLSGGDTAGIPSPLAFFDLITCTNVLHYLQEPVAVLRGLKNLLVEQGQLVLEDYVLQGFPFLWKGFEWLIRLYDPEHHTLLSQETAQRLCLQADLQVVMAQSFPIGVFCQGWVICATRPWV